MAQPDKLLKEQKYDRQLRLWGDHGQEALESAHVLFSPENLLDSDPSFFCRFTVVVATQLPESVCRSSDHLRISNTVAYCHIIESHPDNALEDLRLDKPFPELREHFQSYDLDHMEKKDHSHTPWIVIVAKYLAQWYSETNGRIPKTYKEKEDFRDLIRQGILKNENGMPEDEENFEEAIKNVNTALNTTQIPSNIEDIFNDDCCINITKQTPPFWILARALKEFVTKEGQGNLPVRGTIPDMIADSGKYIKLQNVLAFFLLFAGAAAQEVIKIVTKQFVIFNNTYIYSGMSQTSATYQL
uniref:NEDD8 activating enzyme E1 subunit 1 n=1 Tax=Cavia porcellus TaxID=10141 RepID=A0A286XXB3_CAVPO